MSPAEYLTDVIPAALALLPPQMDTQEARAMLIAIALQESRLTYRKQIGGPARGLHQFETGGVRAVLRHAATEAHAFVLVRFAWKRRIEIADAQNPASVRGAHLL